MLFEILFWAVWLLIGLMLAAVFSGTVFPRLLLEMRASRYPIADRGIGKFNLKNGISVLYEPSRSEREYLCSYQVCRRNDRTVCFLGCWQKAVFTARYTLLCFNSLGRPIAFYRISEKFIGGRRYTRTVPLPYATAYVGFSLERVDGKRIGRAFSPSPFYWIWLSLFLVGLAGLVGYLFFLAVHFSEAVFHTASDLPLGSILTAISCAIVFLPLAVEGARMLFGLFQDRLPLQRYLSVGAAFCRKAKERAHTLFVPVRAVFGGTRNWARGILFRCMNLWSLVKQTCGRIPRGMKGQRRGA